MCFFDEQEKKTRKTFIKWIIYIAMKIAAMHIGYHIMTRALQFFSFTLYLFLSILAISIESISIQFVFDSYKRKAMRLKLHTQKPTWCHSEHDSALSKYQSPFAISLIHSNLFAYLSVCVCWMDARWMIVMSRIVQRTMWLLQKRRN